MPRTGVLVMAFGGPYGLEDVAPFCRNLMGREPSPEVIARVSARYERIGGASPLPGIATSIAGKLHARLGEDVPVALGMRYWEPFIADAVQDMSDRGVERIVATSLSPFESAHSSGAYRAAVTEAAERTGVAVVEAPSFRRTEPFLGFLAEALADALQGLEGRWAVLFSAHSLPADEIAGDPYVEELRETAVEVAARVGLPAADERGGQSWLPGVDAFGSVAAEVPWLVTYQSKGARPGAWLKPDADDVLAALAEAGFDGAVFSPIGFATDHMETRYDLDVEARARAEELGMGYRRAAAPNDGPELIEALAEVVGPLL